MTAEQQAAYWKHQARKHEERARQAPDPAEMRRLRESDQELERLKREQMSDHEKAVAAAREEAEKATAARMGERLVAAEFRAIAAGRVPGLEELVEDLNLTKFMREDGEPDTDAIKARIEALIPPTPPQDQDDKSKGTPGRLDLEQGYRKPPDNRPSTQGGTDLYEQYKKRR